MPKKREPPKPLAKALTLFSQLLGFFSSSQNLEIVCSTFRYQTIQFHLAVNLVFWLQRYNFNWEWDVDLPFFHLRNLSYFFQMAHGSNPKFKEFKSQRSIVNSRWSIGLECCCSFPNGKRVVPVSLFIPVVPNSISENHLLASSCPRTSCRVLLLLCSIKIFLPWINWRSMPSV